MLERCGKFLFRIHPGILFFLFALPLIVVSAFLWMQKNTIEDEELRYTRALQKEKSALQKKGASDKFFTRYSHVDPYFINQKIESIPLLTEEKAKLLSWAEATHFFDSEAIQKRLEAIEKNKFHFAEGEIRSGTKIKEVEEKLLYPVQVDETDIKLILSLIEEIPIDSFTPLPQSPQFVTLSFRLQKRKSPLQTDYYDLEMNLLKRECI